MLPEAPAFASHAHPDIEICIAANFRLRTADSPDGIVAQAALIPSGVEHALEDIEGSLFIIHLSPLTDLGAKLLGPTAAPIAQPTAQYIVNAAGGEAHPEDAHALRDSIMSALALLAPSPENATTLLDPRMLAAVRRLESDELDESVVGLSQALKLRRRGTTQLVRETTGVSPYQFVLWQRTLRAVRSAARGNTLTRAATEAGFTDLGHFSRVYKKLYGVSTSTMLGGTRLDAL